MRDRLNAAVIGLGNMGINHARVYGEMDTINLVSVSDINAQRLASFQQEYCITAYTNYREMIAKENIDLISIVTPTEHHFPIAIDVIEAGIPVLIEKPIALHPEQGRTLIKLAQDRQVLLMVGHIERFNPVIEKLKHLLDENILGEVYHMAIKRMGMFPNRIENTGVVLDMATHDVDIITYLTRSNISRMHAEINRHVHSKHEDFLVATLRLENDMICTLEVNWLSPVKIREITILGARGKIMADTIAQTVTFYQRDVRTCCHTLIDKGISDMNKIEYPVPSIEPLSKELAAFAMAVQNNGTSPVSGEDGVAALATAMKLLDAARH